MNKEKNSHRSNSIKKLVRGGLCGVLLCAAGSSAAIAAEKMTCEYKFLDGSAKGLHGASKIEISGNTLKYFVQTSAPFLSQKPRIFYTETHFKILEKNKVGLVAVKSDALVAPIGPVLGAQILTIGKADGALHIGSAGSTGVYDQLAGHCQ
jgi:hypothetical protein